MWVYRTVAERYHETPGMEAVIRAAAGRPVLYSIVNQQLEVRASEIEKLSDACCVLRLEIFGSAITGRFDPVNSDFDFLVTFRPGSTSLDNYLRLAEGLEALLGRPVDLVIERSIRNPYFRKSVDATRTLIYAGGEQEAAV